MNHTITVLLAAVLLSGCMTRTQVAINQAERDIENFGPRCERLGLKPQTPDWAACVARYGSAAK